MAPFVFLLFLLSDATSVDVVTVHPGEDVTLPCVAVDLPVIAVEWTRPDLEPDNVLFCSDGYLETEDQNPSFKDRVELVDRDLKDGDVSFILKNVNINDQGTYECRVEPADFRRKKRAIIESEPIRIIRLQVTDPADLIVVTVHPGEDAILLCQAADFSIRAVEWTRPDLETEYVLYYSDGHLDPTSQHPSYKDRVDLVDRDLKDGDMSLILKNVNINDQGTYECRVASAGFRRKKRAIINSEPIRIIRLQVPEPAGPNSENSVDENYMDENTMYDDPNSGGYAYDKLPRGYVGLSGFAAPLLTMVLTVVAGVCLKYKRRKNKRSRSAADDVQVIGQVIGSVYT